jgi:hypothetical protein
MLLDYSFSVIPCIVIDTAHNKSFVNQGIGIHVASKAVNY